MAPRRVQLTFSILGLGALMAATNADQEPSLRDQVFETERAFAQTMADRDHEAFTAFLSHEAIFFSGGGAARGREAVAEAWRPLFQGQEAPFSWEPETVEVLDSGMLALSSGPVRNPDGEVIGIFNSIWRREADGNWRVIFDKGCAAPPASSGEPDCSPCG